MFHQLATVLAIAVAIYAIPLRPNTEPHCTRLNLTEEESDSFWKAQGSGKYKNYDDVVLSLKETSPSAYEKLTEEEATFKLEVQKLGKEAGEFARKARATQRNLIMIREEARTAEAYDSVWNVYYEFRALSDDVKAELKRSECDTLP